MSCDKVYLAASSNVYSIGCRVHISYFMMVTYVYDNNDDDIMAC